MGLLDRTRIGSMARFEPQVRCHAGGRHTTSQSDRDGLTSPQLAERFPVNDEDIAAARALLQYLQPGKEKEGLPAASERASHP